MSDPESLIDSVREERAKYGTPLKNVEMGMLLNAVAWKHRAEGWVLAGKGTGAHTLQPQTETPISRDVLMHVPSAQMYDVLRAVARAGEPQWLNIGPVDMPVVHPVDPGVAPPPDPSARYWVEKGLREVEAAEVSLSAAAESLLKALERI